MELFPTTVGEIKRVVQELWDRMDPNDFMDHIENTLQILYTVIKACGYITKY